MKKNNTFYYETPHHENPAVYVHLFKYQKVKKIMNALTVDRKGGKVFNTNFVRFELNRVDWIYAAERLLTEVHNMTHEYDREKFFKQEI